MGGTGVNPPPETNAVEQDEADILRRIEKRLLWLSTYSVHYANNLREGTGGIKIGGTRRVLLPS